MNINFEQVHNFFEPVVFEAVAAKAPAYPDLSAEMLADVACVVLNRLPGRYLRHDVDMMFYMTEHERRAIDESLEEALNFAFTFIRDRAACHPGT